jgi:hypothetical protein
MKQTITIELTKVQIDQLTKAGKELLLANKVKAIEAIEKKFEDDVNELNNQFKTTTIEIGGDVPVDKKKSKGKGNVDVDLIKKLLGEGKNVSQVSKITGNSTVTIKKYK